MLPHLYRTVLKYVKFVVSSIHFARNQILSLFMFSAQTVWLYKINSQLTCLLGYCYLSFTVTYFHVSVKHPVKFIHYFLKHPFRFSQENYNLQTPAMRDCTKDFIFSVIPESHNPAFISRIQSSIWRPDSHDDTACLFMCTEAPTSLLKHLVPSCKCPIHVIYILLTPHKPFLPT